MDGQKPELYNEPLDEGLVMDDKHKSEWYNENAVVIQAKYKQDSLGLPRVFFTR